MFTVTGLTLFFTPTIYWTIKTSDKDLLSLGRQELLMTPNPTQVVTILRLFEVKDKNHLVQIGTGEGKSIILGVASIIFALLDYEHPFSIDADNFFEQALGLTS